MDADTFDMDGALELAGEIGDDCDDRSVYHQDWLPMQLAFLQDPSRRKMARAGNQLMGKTWVTLAEDIFRCLGEHPFLEVPPPPIKVRLICGTAGQSIEIQSKLWELLPKSEIDPSVGFVPGKGFRGREPKVVTFKNGSTITIFTTNQDPLAQAGGTIDVIHFDEPPKNDRYFTEAQNRMIRTGGVLLLSMTPVNAPVEYIRKQAEQGLISDHWRPLTPEQLIPVGQTEPIRTKDGEPMDAEFLEHIRTLIPAYQVPVVIDGEWQFYVIDRVFDAYDETRHERSHEEFWIELLAAQKRCRSRGTNLKLTTGTDHGDGDHKSQSTVLTAVDDSGDYPRFYFTDEYVAELSTTPDIDARQILDMLGRNGQSWQKLDFAVGDRPWQGRYRVKTNSRLMKALAVELGLPSMDDLEPQIQQAKSGWLPARGSVDEGILQLHQAMVRPGHLLVNRDRCPNLSQGFKKWDRKPKSPHVHVIDGARYSTVHWLQPSHGGGRIAVVHRGW